MIDTFLMALRSLRAHLMRSALTLSGIVIGITAVVGMSALIRGVDEVIMGGIRAMNPHVVYLMKAGIVLSEADWRRMMRRPDITYEDLHALREDCKTVGLMDVFAGGAGDLSRGGRRTRGLQVMGVGENYMEVNSMSLKAGRFFTPGEIGAGTRVMVMGKDPVQVLFEGIEPIGRTVRLFGQEYLVVGTFVSQAEVGGFNLGQDNFCVIPHTTHKRDVKWRDDSLMIAMVPREGVSVEKMQEEVARVMRVRHRLRANQENDFDFLTQASFLKLWRELTSTFFLVLLGISSIALLVGGIGVMAIMTVSVTERTREIGVRRAVGAKRGHVLAQFLMEAAFLTAAGGALGSAIGALIAWGLSKALELPFAAPWDTFALAVGASTLIGLVFGVVPAYRAARMDVVDALRCE